MREWAGIPAGGALPTRDSTLTSAAGTSGADRSICRPVLAVFFSGTRCR